MREFAFELALCAHLEDEERIVSRQLGAHVEGRRIVDAVVVEPGPEFAERRAITAETIPPRAVAADVGAGRARYWKDAFDGHPDRARAAMETAVERGFLERERRGGRTYVRQTARYPDWIGRIVAVENKPDLDRPGDLARQLRTDVSLGLADAVVLATASHVTGAHRNRLPDPVGIWRFDPETGERTVVREPDPLPVDEPGVEVLDAQPGHTEIAVVDADAKARARRRLAERAYGKGWRTFDYPACARCEPGDAGLPHCEWAERPVQATRECGPDCAGFESAPAPEPDCEAIRAARTAWESDPEGRRRRQAGLGAFGRE